MKYNKGFTNITIILLAVGIIAVGYFAYRAGKSDSVIVDDNTQIVDNSNNQNQQGGNNQISSTTLPSPYVTAQEGWPPVINNSSVAYSCRVTLDPVDNDHGSEWIIERMINGRKYCVSTSVEYAAGNTYFTFIYTTPNGAGTKTTSFVLRYSNCEMFKNNSGDGGPEYSQCQSTQANFSIDKIVDNLFDIIGDSLSTTLPQYIGGQEGWPPVIKTSTTAYACSMQAQTGNGPSGSTTEKTINGKKYCVTILSDAAAGSRYTEYTYITGNGSGTKTTNFTLRLPNCQNYDHPQSMDCDASQDHFFGGLDALIDSLMQG